MSSRSPEEERPGAAGRPADDARARGMTIGAVCQTLRQEFPDISISKIRYLEDQRLLSPQRTPGGYRLYSAADVDRLRAILRMQRDEFLPLRVIRQELAAGRGARRDDPIANAGQESDGRGEPARQTNVSVSAAPTFHRKSEVLAQARADDKLVRELVDFGLISGGRPGEDDVLFDDAEREIILVTAALGRYGIGVRHLRTFRSSADREAGLLQQLLGPSLQSRNPERRKEATDLLDDLATSVSRLAHLLLVRDLRRLTD